MQEIIQIALTIIASLGGAGFIIIGLANYLGKLWANMALESEKAKYNKELEELKSNLKKEIDTLNKINEKALYISKVQYDNEYKIYQEIWKALNECTIATLQLYPRGIENVPCDEEKKEKYKEEKYIRFSKTYTEYYDTIEKYAPFYKKEFYEKFIELRTKCFKIGDVYKMFEFDVKYNESFKAVRDMTMPMETEEEVYIKLPKEIMKIKEDLLKEIREYLFNLQLKN